MKARWKKNKSQCFNFKCMQPEDYLHTKLNSLTFRNNNMPFVNVMMSDEPSTIHISHKYYLGTYMVNNMF